MKLNWTPGLWKLPESQNQILDLLELEFQVPVLSQEHGCSVPSPHRSAGGVCSYLCSCSLKLCFRHILNSLFLPSTAVSFPTLFCIHLSCPVLAQFCPDSWESWMHRDAGESSLSETCWVFRWVLPVAAPPYSTQPAVGHQGCQSTSVCFEDARELQL